MAKNQIDPEDAKYIGEYITQWGVKYEIFIAPYKRGKIKADELVCRKDGVEEYYPKSRQEIERSLRFGQWERM